MAHNARSHDIARYQPRRRGRSLFFLTLAGTPARSQIPGFGTPTPCPPNMSCVPGTPTTPTTPGTCGPAPAGPTCGAGGPASVNSAPAVNVGAGNPINVITGNKYQREVDMAPLPGALGLEIVRHYNSAYSRPNHSTNLLGRGWKLSYETELVASRTALQIVQADGARIIFSRDARNPSLCQSANPADGAVHVVSTRRGEEYRWRWPNGRELSFDGAGRLVQILAPGGQFVMLQHDRRGLLVKVTDPQGRSLHLNYPGKTAAKDGYRGVQSIDSPVGRFTYGYGSPVPKGSAVVPQALLANLVKVGYPSGARYYHYENPQFPTLLTGVSELADTPGGKSAWQRVSTFGYDANGKGNLTVKGHTARWTAPSGRRLQGPAPGTGIEQVNLNHDVPGQTTITDSLGRKTVYTHALVAGEYRLLEVRGAGCASCGAPNMRYRYDQGGRLVEETRLGASGLPVAGTRYAFDGAGRIQQVTDLAYAQGRIATERWRLRYRYQGTDVQPAAIVRPSVVEGKDYVTEIAYAQQGAAAGMPLAIVERGYLPAPDGKGGAHPIERAIRYAYNGYGQRVEIDGPLPNAPAASPANADVTRIAYDSRTKLPLRTVAPGGIVTEVLERDRALRPLVVRTTHGDAVHTATLQLNWRGQPEQVRIAARFAGQPEDQQLVRTLRYRYDAAGRMSALTQPDGATTGFVHNAAGQLIARIQPDGSRVALDPDTEGRQRSLTVRDAAGAVALLLPAMLYDEANRVRAMSGSEGEFKLAYDDAGRVVSMTNAIGVQTRLDYDAAGLLVGRTAAAGTPDAATLRIGRDRHGNATLITDPNGVVTRRFIDDFGRQVAELNGDRGITLYRHDAAGRLVERLDSTGESTRYAYDHVGRLSALGSPEAPALVSYRYQGPHLREVLAPGERTGYRRNAFGQVLEEERRLAAVQGLPRAAVKVSLGAVRALTFVTRYEYDASGRLVRKTLPDGHRLGYRYGRQAGRGTGLDAILFDDRVLVADIRYGAAGGVAGYVASNGVRQSIRTDTQGRIVQLDAVSGPAPERGWLAWPGGAGAAARLVYRQRNAFDAAGRLARIARQGNGADGRERIETFVHDSQDRLVEFDDERGRRVRLAYDAGGNRTSERAGGPASAFFYAAGTNQLIGLAQQGKEQQPPLLAAWLHHPAGMPLARLGAGPVAHQRIEYNGARRPLAVHENGRVLARYHYNVFGERIAKTVYPAAAGAAQVRPASHAQGHTVYSLYEGQRLAAQADADGRITAHYVYLHGRPVAKIEVGAQATGWRAAKAALSSALGRSDGVTVYAIHGDHLGTPQVVTGPDQQVVWKASTSPFGQAAVHTGGAFEMDLRLPGQVYDRETGLHQNYYRDYDPRTGRYVTADPMGLAGGINPYAYVSNSPLTHADPLGLYEEDIHYYMTFFLAIAAGVDYQEARIIALATQYVDDNDITTPVDGTNWLTTVGSVFVNQEKLLKYHFTLSSSQPGANHGKTDAAYANDDLLAPINNPSTQLQNLLNASNRAPTRCGQLQLFGEYLHALEDTFTHRRADNTPYDALQFGLGIGHGLDGHQPDYTYDGTLESKPEWKGRPDRTLKMEEEVFKQIRDKFGNASKAMSWDNVAKIVDKFNREKENAGKGFNEKFKILNAGLKWYKVKLPDGTEREINVSSEFVDGYNEEQGRKNRNSLLCDE